MNPITYIKQFLSNSLTGQQIYLGYTKKELQNKVYLMEIELENLRSQLRAYVHQNEHIQKDVKELKNQLQNQPIIDKNEYINPTTPSKPAKPVSNSIMELEIWAL